MAVANAINSQQVLSNAGTPTFATLALSAGSTQTVLTGTCTLSGSAAGPYVVLKRSKAASAADLIGYLEFDGWNSATSNKEYAHIVARIITTTAGSEDGALDFYTTAAGTSTKQMSLINTGGQYRGNNTNTTPPAGYLGEILSSYIVVGSAVSLSDSTPANITSLSLTAGIWEVTAFGIFTGTLTGTKLSLSISATSATLGTALGNDTNVTPTMPTATSDQGVTVPNFRVELSSTTTYYMVAQANFSGGTATGYGKLKAVRVG